MAKELRIALRNGKFVVAETGIDPNHPEICVVLEDEEGFVQDICIVRHHLDLSSEDVRKDNNCVDCLVYSDEQDENYTHKFVIKHYEEDEA